MNENQLQQNQPEKISEYKPKKRSVIKIIFIVIISLIATIGISIGLNYILASEGSYPNAHICNATSDCANYCPNNGTPLCSEKPVEENDTRSIFERLTAGELNFIDIFIPDQKYCACQVVTQRI